jgi:hypothetical protein
VLPPERQFEFHVAHTLTTDTNDLGILFPLLRLMTERLGRRLRRRGLTAGQLRVDTTYADYTTGSRTVSLRTAALDAELWEAAQRAFVLANSKRLAVRAVALTLGRLLEEEEQLELWEGGRAVGRYGGTAVAEDLTHIALQNAVDRVRARYGAGAVRGGQLASHRPLPAAHENPTALPPYRRTASLHQATTIFPKVALPSMTRCASAS